MTKQYCVFDCIIFHDADFIPADDRHRYDCPTSPRHMAPAVEKFKYQLYYNTYFGGVIAVSRQDLEGKISISMPASFSRMRGRLLVREI